MKRTYGRMAPLLPILLIVQACSPGHFIGQIAAQDLLKRSELRSGQVGISIYDPAARRYLYDHQGSKYFIPASNTKLFTTYAVLKWLGDSLAGICYRETDTALFVEPTGDPTLLHPDFPDQPVIRFLQLTKKKILLIDKNWQDEPWGRGWAWDDYNEDYMPERNSLPVYGNTIRWVQEQQKQETGDPSFTPSPSIYSLPEIDWTVRFSTDTIRKTFFVRRERDENRFIITEGKEKYRKQDVPFITHGLVSAIGLLKDTVGKTVFVVHEPPFPPGELVTLYSRPVDSLLKPMLFNSDNFFAEQGLLMVSNQRLGRMNDADIINYLEKNDLGDLPQKPVWVDGCGLSRMNLFTTHDLVWILDKMSRDFGLSRMERLLPTGGSGTLANYYKEDSSYIFAKTGSMSGVVALSGYLVTKKNRLLIFSILVNNYSGGATAVRRKIEGLVHRIRERY